jgi:site-specific DNA-methyltransferase (adenine-specific)
VTLTDEDRERLRPLLIDPTSVPSDFTDCTIFGDGFDVAPHLPSETVDLLIFDPPYNMSKRFGDRSYSKISVDDYAEWLGSALDVFLPVVKPNGTVYICGDWHTSTSIYMAAAPRLHIRNRITWEREKGRGANSNWKNSSEDIWYCTLSDDYTFNVKDVKLRRDVIAPYRDSNGKPRDWIESKKGNYRDTFPSNLWSDITIPFWSMRENTDHPTQKSEKLIAKLILASTNPGDVVLDPFLGSGTSSVAAHKLDRRYIGIEVHEEYALLAEKRLELASLDQSIQGYVDGVFWERNSLGNRSASDASPTKEIKTGRLL